MKMTFLIALGTIVLSDQLAVSNDIIKKLGILSIEVYKEEPITTHEFILKNIAKLPKEEKIAFCKELNAIKDVSPEKIFSILPKSIANKKVTLIKNKIGHMELIETED